MKDPEERKARQRAAQAKHRQTEKYKAGQAEYRQSSGYKAAQAVRAQAARDETQARRDRGERVNRAPCRRIGVAEDGRPYCVHGPMLNATRGYGCIATIREYSNSYYITHGERVRAKGRVLDENLKRARPCKPIEHDETGRWKCEHGWAHKWGTHWLCPQKHARIASRRKKEHNTPEEWEQYLSQKRTENLTPERVEARNAKEKERIGNLSPEQRELHRMRKRQDYFKRTPAQIRRAEEKTRMTRRANANARDSDKIEALMSTLPIELQDQLREALL